MSDLSLKVWLELLENIRERLNDGETLSDAGMALLEALREKVASDTYTPEQEELARKVLELISEVFALQEQNLLNQGQKRSDNGTPPGAASSD